MSNKIGRIVSLQREATPQTFYLVQTLAGDLNTVVDTVTGIAIDATFEVGDLVHLNVVQGRHYIISSKASDDVVLKITGKWNPAVTDIPTEDFTFAIDDETAPDTLMYVAEVVDNVPTYDAIVVDPTGEVDPILKGDKVLCRLLEGAPTKFELAVDSLVSAYAVQDIYFTLKPKGGAGSTVPCRIDTKVAGLNYTYRADIYGDGIEGGVAPTILATGGGQVEQVNINVDQTIPAGTWAMASLNSNGIWYVQVAVWL